MSYYLTPDSQEVTVAFFAKHAASQPGIAALAETLGCHVRIAARIAAEKMYASGLRTTSLCEGFRVMHHADNPVGPVDDDPGPGVPDDLAKVSVDRPIHCGTSQRGVPEC